MSVIFHIHVSFKIIQRYYQASHCLLKFQKDICINSSFCEMHPETMQHIFWQCPYTNKFWKDVSQCMVDNIDSDFSLYWKNILFGFFNNNCYTINEL